MAKVAGRALAVTKGLSKKSRPCGGIFHLNIVIAMQFSCRHRNTIIAVMSLGDLYHKNRFSLRGELKPDRFGRADHLPDQRVELWRFYLQEMRYCWEHGEPVEVITDFFEYFDPTAKPPRWPDWLKKP
jgi:hypothetical protein